MKEQARLISYYPHGFPTTRTPILLSRFSHLNTFKIPPLTFRHTTPALAYTSGMYSLPSAAARGGRSAVAGSIRFSRFNRSGFDRWAQHGPDSPGRSSTLCRSLDWHTRPGFRRLGSAGEEPRGARVITTRHPHPRRLVTFCHIVRCCRVKCRT